MGAAASRLGGACTACEGAPPRRGPRVAAGVACTCCTHWPARDCRAPVVAPPRPVAGELAEYVHVLHCKGVGPA